MLGEDQLASSPGFKFDGACANDPTVIDDFLFLDAWERGLLPSLSAFLRARRIRRAERKIEQRLPEPSWTMRHLSPHFK
jgi:hypothetical protein